ncbi:hypothetical protein OMAG_001896 [Candidatus Omnitrophus magneticus]|uniref:DUF2061 domain-containing protein n=1 Tax=Candidatus Omnitrophus magneticus TaxID=1609969 RepID=A0A0F0CLV4_9BACT|nr:hypothetical protein OMAG_001896 [Candidatus Omnitrophus magneticus]
MIFLGLKGKIEMEHPKRSFFKALSWRVVGLIITIITIYLYSKKIKDALAVGLISDLIKFGIYYFHERAWNKVDFGREKKEPEYNI